MKILAVALLFALPVFAGPVNPARPYEFEAEPGCMWKKNEGRCVVLNRLNDTIKCKVSITGKTKKGLTVGNTRQVAIPAKMYNDDARVLSDEGDDFTVVTASAECIAGV